MFVTMPQFEQTSMSQLAEGGQQYWRAVTAAFPHQPWYLFSYRDLVIDRFVELAQLVAWEESLLNIMELVPIEDRRAVYRVEPAKAGGLRFRALRGVWAPAPEEAAAGVHAVFSLEDVDGVVDDRLQPMLSGQERRLVFHVDAAAASRAGVNQSSAH